MFKKVLSIFLLTCAVVALFIGVFSTVDAIGVEKITPHLEVTGFRNDVDYMKEMHKCATDGSKYALQVGSIYEAQRNLKLENLGRSLEKTSYFSTFDNGERILIAMKADQLKKEYWDAGFVYEYLRVKGYSDVVIAGILGNMMNECGGNTLNLQSTIYGGRNYYGVCMWSLTYAKGLAGGNLIQQLNYLTETIEPNMKVFGGSHERFKALTDAGAAARYFNTYYERGSGGYQRACNAYKALNWIQKERG